MAQRSRSIIFAALILTITLWIWVLTLCLFWIRWNSFIRPGAPIKEIFPYGEIRIGVDASYPPFATATDSGLFGIDIDIGNAIGKNLNIPVRFINMGYDGLYDSLKADQADILISALAIDYSRSNDVLFTVPYFNAGLVLVSDQHHKFSGMSVLGGHSLAYEFGSDANLTARAWLRRIVPFQLMPYETPDFALDSVRFGLSDAALVDATSSRLYLRQHQGWHVTQTQVTDTLFGIAVAANHGRAWKAVNDGLKALIDDKTIETILRQWL